MTRNTRNQVIALFLISVFFAGMLVMTTVGSSTAEPKVMYNVDLVIATVPSGNQSLGSQYIFFQSENGSLTSSAVITVPAATEIKITIINHDSGRDAPLVQAATIVTGVVGNSIHVFNNSIPLTSLAAATSVSYNSVPASDLSHTFSTSTGVNIPILPNSTEVAYTYFQNTGTYDWGCLCQCGQFSMNSPGWMMGQINVVLP